MCEIIAKGMVQDINDACDAAEGAADIPLEVLQELKKLYVEDILDEDFAPDFAPKTKEKRQVLCGQTVPLHQRQREML